MYPKTFLQDPICWVVQVLISHMFNVCGKKHGNTYGSSHLMGWEGNVRLGLQFAQKRVAPYDYHMNETSEDTWFDKWHMNMIVEYNTESAGIARNY